MASKVQMAEGHESPDASNSDNRGSSANFDADARKGTSSGPVRGNYVRIELLGRALKIAVESDPHAVEDRRGSNCLPKAVNLDKFMKTITKLQEQQPGSGPSDGTPQPEGATNTVSSDQDFSSLQSVGKAREREQGKASTGQGLDSSLAHPIPAPSATQPKDIIVPHLVAAQQVQSLSNRNQDWSPRDVPNNRGPLLGRVLLDAPARLAIQAEGLGPSNSGVNNSSSPHGNGNMFTHDTSVSHLRPELHGQMGVGTPLSPGSIPTPKSVQVRSSSRRGPSSKTSPYRGVSCYKRTGRWEAHIWHSGRQVHLGTYSTSEEAARVYDTAAIKLRGWTADLNFNVEDYRGDPDLEDAPIQLDKKSEEQGVAEMVKCLKRRSKGYGGRGGKRGKQCLDSLSSLKTGAPCVAVSTGDQLPLQASMASHSALGLGQVHRKDKSPMLHNSMGHARGMCFSETSMLASGKACATREPLCGAGAAAGSASGHRGDSHYGIKGVVEPNQQFMLQDSTSRVPMWGTPGNMLVASGQDSIGLVSTKVVEELNGGAYLGYMASGFADPTLCRVQNSCGSHVAPSRLMPRGVGVSLRQACRPEKIVANTEIGTTYIASMVQGSPVSTSPVDGKQCGSLSSSEVVLEGKPVGHKSCTPQVGIAAYWPGQQVEQVAAVSKRLDRLSGQKNLSNPRSLCCCCQSSRCIHSREQGARSGEEEVQGQFQVMPLGQSRLLQAADLGNRMAKSGGVWLTNSGGEDCDQGYVKSTPRIAQLMEAINQLPMKTLVKAKENGTELKRGTDGSLGKHFLDSGVCAGKLPASGLQVAQVCKPSPSTSDLNLKEEPTGTHSGSLQVGKLALRSAEMGSVAMFPADMAATAQSHCLQQPVGEALKVETEVTGPLPAESRSHDSQVITDMKIVSHTAFHLSQHENSSCHQSGNNRSSSDNECQENSLVQGLEETEEDLLAAQQLCALATAGYGYDGYMACNNSSDSSRIRKMPDSVDEDPLPSWSVKRMRTNSSRPVRQDFEGLQCVLRYGSMDGTVKECCRASHEQLAVSAGVSNATGSRSANDDVDDSSSPLRLLKLVSNVPKCEAIPRNQQKNNCRDSDGSPLKGACCVAQEDDTGRKVGSNDSSATGIEAHVVTDSLQHKQGKQYQD